MFSVKPELTYENIKKRISSYHIFKIYCTNFENINQKFFSEFREESEPSCCIAVINGDLLFKDFGTGESYRATNYVMKKYNLSFPQALHKINHDFKLGLQTYLDISSIKSSEEKASKIIKENVPSYKEKSISIIKIKRRNRWRPEDLNYWKQYYWTKEMLEKAHISPISHYWIQNRKATNMFSVVRKLAFSYDYYIHDGVFRRKIYLPGVGNDKSRFYTNADKTVVQGVHLLPKSGGDILFVTSSLKDCGIFWRLGFNAVAPNSEETFLPENYFYKVKERWKRIVIWYNNDWHKQGNPGVRNAKKFSEKYNLEYYHNPNNTPKDPSDFVKEYELKAFNELIKSRLHL